MSARRGLTLLEVLAATVLLAMLAGACVPILRRAARALNPPPTSIELRELAVLADAFMAEPSESGFAAESMPGEFELTWPDSPDRDPVSVEIMTTEAPNAEHLWLIFAADEWFVLRWMKCPEATP